MRGSSYFKQNTNEKNECNIQKQKNEELIP